MMTKPLEQRLVQLQEYLSDWRYSHLRVLEFDVQNICGLEIVLLSLSLTHKHTDKQTSINTNLFVKP